MAEALRLNVSANTAKEQDQFKKEVVDERIQGWWWKISKNERGGTKTCSMLTVAFVTTI